MHFTFPFLVVCTYRKVKRMEIFIKGTPEEIAALAREMQERQGLDKLTSGVVNRLREKQYQNEPVFQP